MEQTGSARKKHNKEPMPAWGKAVLIVAGIVIFLGLIITELLPIIATIVLAFII